MFRVLIFLGLVLAAAVGFAWLADRPGSVAIDWLGYQIEISAMLAMIAVMVVIVGVMATWWVLKVIVRSPQIMGGYFSARRRDRGYEALSSGLVAAGSGDSKSAQRFAQQAQKLVPDAPLTQVLSASSADLNGDANAKRQAYRRMLDDPKTQLLGLRGLYLDAVQDDDEEAARHYASQAAALAPALPWAGQAQLEDQVQRGDWPAARAALERNLQARIITKKERNRLRAVLLTAEAIDREEGEPEQARALAVEANKLAPDLVPAGAVAGRLLIRTGKMTQASKVIEATWRKAPHPELAEVYLYVRPGDAVADRVKRARKLTQLCAHQAEGEMALARALMEAGDLDEARKLLEPMTGDEATQRVCLLMAEIEEKQGGDTAAVRGWMARALRAKRDPAWVADGYISSTWEPVSPLTGQIDAFEWKVPVERFSGHDPVAIPDDAMADDGQVMLPARLPGVAPMAADEAVVEDSPDSEVETSEPADHADAELVIEAEPEATTEPEPIEEPELDEAEASPTAEGPEAANDDGPAEVVAPAKAEAEAPEPEEAEPSITEAAVDDAADDESTATADNVTPMPLPDAEPEDGEEKAYSGLPGGHAPDDPGPQPDEDKEEDKERRRFRLF